MRGRALSHQRHADRQRQGDQRGRQLQDRRALGPACGDEFDRGDANQASDEEDDDVGEREADPLDSLRSEVENEADLRMVAPPIGDGAADEGEDRQDKPGDFVRPEKGLSKDDARQNVGKHEQEFAKQRADDNRFGQPVERAQSKRLRCGAADRRFGVCLRPQPRAVAIRRH